MKIGILECGRLSAPLAEQYGDYPEMFEKLLAPYMPDTDFLAVSVVAGKIPDATDDADGWLLTGSAHGVYDDHDWLQPLSKFILRCFADHVPLAGICFGHQLIANIMGGHVHQSNKGWQLGVKKYDFINKPDWIDGLDDEYYGHAVHQDQITKLPEDATLIATSEFCEYAALVYGDPEYPDAITLQSHPELSEAFVRLLSDTRLKDIVPKSRLTPGLATLAQHVDNPQWAATIARYFQRAHENSQKTA